MEEPPDIRPSEGQRRQQQQQQQQHQQQTEQQQQQQQRPMDETEHAMDEAIPAVPATSDHNSIGGGSLITSTPSTLTASSQHPHSISTESPLPPMVQRVLGDRSQEKRKNAALEIEALIKSLQEANNATMIQSVISILSKDFCTSMNSNYRKGGLIGLAATAIGLMQYCVHYLDTILPPVLHCTDDPEARVRYYACESLYNIAKVSRWHILDHFNSIFEGLTKLYADVDVDVKNGAILLDRLIKDIVTESESFHVEQFLPLLQNYIRRTNPYIRQLLVGWITLLDSIPDISMIDYLPDFLDGLFNVS
jgi:vacuole morphology and inheritance protein 14